MWCYLSKNCERDYPFASVGETVAIGYYKEGGMAWLMQRSQWEVDGAEDLFSCCMKTALDSVRWHASMPPHVLACIS
jgi:hypothetical protein